MVTNPSTMPKYSTSVKRKFASLSGLLKFSFVALAMMVGVACDKKVAVTVQPTVVEEEKQIQILSWDEYFAPEVLAEFTKRTGIEVAVQIYFSTEEMEEKLKSNPQKYDVLVAEQAAVVSLRMARLLMKLEKPRLANFNNLDPNYLNQEFDPGNEFSVPYMWGTTVVAYRKDHFETPPEESLNLLFNDKLQGKISLLDERNECYAMMIGAGGDPLANVSMESMNKATDRLMQLVTKQKARFGSDNEMKAHLISGDSSAAMIYSGDAALIAQTNKEIAYFIPKEGAVVWVDSFAIPRDSQKVGNAHKFIDYMVEAGTAAASSNFLRYASPNKAAAPLIDESLLQDKTIYPPAEIRAKCATMPVWTKDQLRIMNAGWKMAKEATPPGKVQASAVPK